MNIYLVEDDQLYSDFVKKSLSQNPSYKVTVFETAEDALKALEAGLPDAMIVDYKLPGMSGIELFEAIKGKIENQKVIMLSAIDDGNMVLSFIQKGVRDYVIKDDTVIESLVAVLEGNDEDYLFN